MGVNASVSEAAKRPQSAALSEERSCAEALMMACDERLGAQSPAALMVCDTFLARDFWASFVHQSYLPPAASEMWGWGENNYGQLGVGDTKNRATPTEVTALHGRCIHTVACGLFETMAVVDDGELWATGFNYFGQLGLGDSAPRSSFTRVSGLSGKKVAAVACGGNGHTLALLESGELFACGRSDYGQLGLGNYDDKKTHEHVAALSGRRVAAIACGEIHSVAVLETGELFAWGRNTEGQLGLGDNANRKVPTQVTALAGRRVVSVSCGGWHTAAVLESSELFTWGYNGKGQLGHGDRTFRKTPQLVEALRGRPVVSVASGRFHILVLLKSGDVFSCGLNDMGQLGLGRLSLKLATAPQKILFFDGKRVKGIYGNFGHSAALLENNSFYVWGEGASRSSRASPTPKPTLVALGSKKRVFSFGVSFHGIVTVF